MRDARDFIDASKDEKNKRQRTNDGSKDNQTFTLTNLGQNPPRVLPDGTQSFTLQNVGSKPLEFKLEGKGTYKMALCMYFESGKGCGKGDTCTYAHGVEELRQNIERQGGFNKSVMCKFFEQGSCRNGTACRFAHSTEEMKEAGPASGKGGTKTLPCKFFENGYCGRGDLCSFAHGDSVIQAAKAQDAEKTMDDLLQIEAQQLMGQGLSSEDARALAEARRGKGKGSSDFNNTLGAKGDGRTDNGKASGRTPPGVPLPVPPPPPLALGVPSKRLPSVESMAEIHALMCPAHRDGKCEQGDKCNLAHSVEDIIAGLIACGVCTLHLVAECQTGASCKFAHVSEDQKACLDSMRSQMIKTLQ